MKEEEKRMLVEAKRVHSFHNCPDSGTSPPSQYFHTSILWSEHHTLTRLLYKYHNQQRRHPHFRRLKLLDRRLRRLHTLQSYIHWGTILKNIGEHRERVDSVDFMGSMVETVRGDCLRAYELLAVQVGEGLFVPFGVVGAATVARIYGLVGRLGEIVKAIRLDLHALGNDDHVQSTSAHSNSDIKTMRQRRKEEQEQERVEEGWDTSTNKDKKKKFTKKKLKKTTAIDIDEIDDIFSKTK